LHRLEFVVIRPTGFIRLNTTHEYHRSCDIAGSAEQVQIGVGHSGVEFIPSGIFHQMKLKDLMSIQVESVAPNASLQEAAEKMLTLNVSALPVYYDGELRGVSAIGISCGLRQEDKILKPLWWVTG
jgi:CBS domain-containing protein